MFKFPKDFFWGAATSAYQVEGRNINSDWWEWEERTGVKEPSGLACRHYDLYNQDFDLARLLNHNCHRLSVEWSRIEPRMGEFSLQEIGHYKGVISSLRQRGIEPIVTLHHFSNPVWFSKLGGWLNNQARQYFLGYVENIVEALCADTRFWVTINEPMVYVYLSYIRGLWPPQETSLSKSKKVTANLISAHIEAYRLIHNIYARRALAKPSVSIAQNLQAFETCRANLRNRFAVYLRDKSFNFEFINKLIAQNSLDFIGVNYYSRMLVDAKSWRIKSLLLDVCEDNHKELKKNSLGWDIYPQGLRKLLLKLKKFDLPVFILENGICTEDDSQRWDFIYEHLKSLSLAISDGVKVLGYIYWSLLDNYEWDKGFGPRFGLIELDYKTYKRIIRPSAYKYSRVCARGLIE